MHHNQHTDPPAAQADHAGDPLDHADLSEAAEAASQAEPPGAAKKATKKAARKKAAKKTAKKTAKKAAAKKTTKKTEAKTAKASTEEPEKKTKKKAAKKAASKKTAKKATAKKAKKTTKKSAGKTPPPAPRGEAAPEGADLPEPIAEPIAETVTQPDAETASGPDAAAEPSPDLDVDAPAPGHGATVEMIVNYYPGEDCRIAILEDGKREEYFSEPTSSVSRVGNIYVGKVVNVEPNIQAAFVDFGLDEAAFLHVSDLHPKYFPGAEQDETERVGFKTPRRERPTIQQALKKGQEITVQVLKEGVGTKGPSVTSYLSIPGRYLVMMPGMDKVGVSRKVEDEDQRREMRRILDKLDLPEGFGFILRTAGFDRDLDELRRDLAYLKRLWADMERRRKRGGGPRLLYSESDLLVRTIRDELTGDVSRVVIDHESALRRAGAFLSIAAPKSRATLHRYTGGTPIFHAFGVEQQLSLMHATEVPLPSGGALVIEQTEALVAIDVNSGKSRGARDAETNAFKTNLEAADEICRQLRLRDLGGLVVCDLIDMRQASHRKKIEDRFEQRLGHDRAKSTILPISRFGILEMTRQRMRGSYEQQHFATCPRCDGRGLVQRPASVAADGLRDLAALLEHDKVHAVELVVNPWVAGALLSQGRRTLERVEREQGKRVDVRISESVPPGRVVLYPYDASGSAIEPAKLPKKKAESRVEPWEPDHDLDSFAIDPGKEAASQAESDAEAAEAEAEARAHEHAQFELPPEEGDEGGKKKRKRRRRRKKQSDEQPQSQAQSQAQSQPQSQTPPEPEPSAQPTAAEAPRAAETTNGHEEPHSSPFQAIGEQAKPAADDDASTPAATDADNAAAGEPSEDEAASGKKRKRRRRRRKKKSGDEHAEGETSPSDNGAPGPALAEPKPGRQRTPDPQPEAPPQANTTAGSSAAEGAGEDAAKKATKKKRRRTLYGKGRRALSPSEKDRIAAD